MQEAALTFAEIISGARIIPLSNGEITFVDEEDFQTLKKLRWYRIKGGYAVNDYRNKGKRTMRYMHREIMQTPRGMQTDHVNRNKLDNRRINLRIATAAQNQGNRGIDKRNTSGLKGVIPYKNGKWMAQIKIANKSKYLGLFESKHEAHGAYMKAASEYHGAFASAI